MLAPGSPELTGAPPVPFNFSPSRKPRLEIVAAVNTVLASVWSPPVEVTEANLLKADVEAGRLQYEWELLAHQVQNEGEQEAIQPLMDRANELIDYVIFSPVQSAATALLSMRHLIGGAGGSGRGILDCGPDETHEKGFERILEWLEAQAAQDRPAWQPQHPDDR
jgi:hypothetical protein